MKRVNVFRSGVFSRLFALLLPFLLGINGLVYASAEAPAEAVHAEAAAHAEGGHESAGDVIMHHILDTGVMSFEPFGEVHLPQIVIGGFDISITRHVVMMWIASAILLVVFLLVGNRYKTMTSRQAPGGMANAMEALVEFIRLDVAKSNIGAGYEKHLPYLLTVFAFILLLNLLGLVPYGATATGNINVTLTLAVFTFFITQVASLKAHGIKGYLAHLTAGTHWALWIIMIPIEIIGLFTKPFALTVRLFANMTAGHIVILSLIFISFILKSYIVAMFVSVPFSIFIYLLEIFVAFLQAFIFTMLSALFIGLATAHEGHEGEAAH
ncbi:MAG: F0F1 ATP synthase subunit A [Prosthecochloris sp.]|uniref:ATP synthase subunit a 2 n=1 Tax=Prosthecochloris aestuarii (strain DSM 271 / SK 413) TaxID=290512 RepID=ATP62_PROA2|nr:MULTISPECIES: F0F1 ATP synthase subunit A [Prosthecochloris]B4S6E6.1 RecName: Full=ATP synthase subunit a 2; AltName: Full=ATP synthase F0 sector subunit a 2; AltName: Full=F-ATPase subunit 6 2; Flags: Precursor [Prosthecochloris aestuarii DSM 271]ACF47248.1 ATP synthase F0, A subunit [Prosthecochloris aestuarii DSM 271]MCW8798221.1 F0F1 ATP synthase subunit A [Prosthecochloris sp.]RDD29238.1 ATP synthase subunit a 2 [Prosthecochloris sp. ZM]